MPANTSIATIKRNTFFKIGIDNHQTGIIHFVVTGSNMQHGLCVFAYLYQFKIFEI